LTKKIWKSCHILREKKLEVTFLRQGVHLGERGTIPKKFYCPVWPLAKLSQSTYLTKLKKKTLVARCDLGMSLSSLLQHYDYGLWRDLGLTAIESISMMFQSHLSLGPRWSTFQWTLFKDPEIFNVKQWWQRSWSPKKFTWRRRPLTPKSSKIWYMCILSIPKVQGMC
jgi:hypothetical protein